MKWHTAFNPVVAHRNSLQCQGFLPGIWAKCQAVSDRCADNAVHGIVFLRHQVEVFGLSIPVQIPGPLQVSGDSFGNRVGDLIQVFRDWFCYRAPDTNGVRTEKRLTQRPPIRGKTREDTKALINEPVKFLGTIMSLIVGGNDTTRNSIDRGPHSDVHVFLV